MQGRKHAAALAAIALAVGLALAPADASAQQGGTTGTPGVGTPSVGTGGTLATTDTTGPNAPLTLGTGSDAQFTSSGGGGTIDETEPLAETGGGEVAIGLGALMLAGGAGLRAFSAPRGR